MYALSTRSSRSVAETTTPVRPMPPAVASKSCGSPSGVTILTSPSGVSSSNARTWSQNEPSRWWFLPCTSAAMAPPTVTWAVPGVTATNSPSGSSSRVSPSMLRPASTVAVCPSTSTSRTAARRVIVSTRPPGVLRRVAVAATQPARERAARAGLRQRRGDRLDGGRLDDLGAARAGAPPAREQTLPRLGRGVR